MKALRFIKTVEEDRIIISNLESLNGKTVELIILPIEDEEEEDWKEIGLSGLSNAYDDNEPAYTSDEVKERNQIGRAHV